MKLSPLSIPYRLLRVASGFVWVLIFAGFGSVSMFGMSVGTAVLAGLFGLGFLVLVGYQVRYYQRFEYRLTADSLDITSGVLSRTNREIPLRRIQNVDIHRNLIQRALDIAEVRVETAGGSSTEAHLRYVSTDAARRLVNEVGRLKRGAVDDTEEAPASTLLYEISSRELALLGLVSLDLRFVPILTVAVPVVVPSLSRFIVTDPVTGFILAAPLGIIALIVLSVVTSGAAAIANYYGFRLSRANGDLRYERGLLQRYDGTIPLDKVQTLTIRENLVQRLVDHATLGVETAGYAPGQGTTLGSEAAVPLAPKDRVVSLAQTIEPFGDPTFERPPKRARQRYAVRYTLALLALTGVLFAVIRFSGFEIGWWVPLLGIPLTPVAAHYQWKNRGYALTDDYVLTQAGFWVRTTKIVPYYRVQTVATSASIFQRYRDLATLTVDTAGARSIIGSNARALDIDAATAATLRDVVADRLQASLRARRVRG
ncbi:MULTISPECIES: PH domain-containing protein [unclassified Haladaptatus]|uniref:PH domain-containing protein n=1 Tax=unclassified Haladaptatus TaxID=2622732 RepID=UPI0023E8A3A2|nr:MULTISPECIES: PH domain-containing protein [unclassified Haladaptatus]